jgi:hypothetical protein
MSSKLITRIAALVVAVTIPLGATASSAHAATTSPYVVTGGDNDGAIGFTAYSPYRSSWS